jgi:iron complex transport system ATP-binding protein
MRLQAISLGAIRGRRQVLADLQLDCRGGEFVAVIGPNGSGKSTLLATLAGLQRADTGAVCLDGQPIGTIAPLVLARRRAYLPQNARCEWPLPVERMVALGLGPIASQLRAGDAGEKARIDAVLADCDLLEQRSQPVTTLSGGELARAMLARALIADPQMLIVDEPLAGLDPRHAWDAARRLRQLAEDGPAAATISDGLLRELFDIEATVSDGTRPYVDFSP